MAARTSHVNSTGTYMAEAQQVVVVSVNYRLGIFGFLGSSQLAKRTTGALGSSYGTGNYGLQDQRAAMEWTKTNIHAFGGDSTRVMIHGCSAGGVSIANHLTQPLSWPFFTSAAMESGNQLTFTDAVSMSDAQRTYDGLLHDLGCSNISCLLGKSMSTLLNSRGHWSPVVDSVNLLDYPRELLRAGKVKRVPTIVGSARDEVAGLDAHGLLQYANLTESTFRAWLAQNYGKENVDRMLALYPTSSARVGMDGGACAGADRGSRGCSVYYYLLVAIVSDDAVVCAARNVAQLLPEGMAYQYR
jgi:para-nitrobenzyl esterase